jgi:hypothetical protein
MRHRILAFAAAIALSGCQTWGPTWSEVTGSRYFRAELNKSPTIIEQIDGNSAFPTRPIKIEPGVHLLTLQGVPLRPGWQGYLKEMKLDMKPCQRYYVNAKFEGPLTPSDWVPVIDYVEPIAGCTVVASK